MTARPSKPPREARKPHDAYHHGNLRRALLDAATAVMAERGAEAVRLRELARSLGVTHRAAYRHFADRDALVVAVAIEGWERLAEALEHARARADAPVRTMLRAYVRFALTQGGHYRGMLGPGASGAPMPDALARAVFTAIRIVEAEVVAQTGERGRPARDRVFAIWGQAHGLCDLVLCGYARAASAHKAEDWILRLCAPALVDAGLR